MLHKLRQLSAPEIQVLLEPGRLHGLMLLELLLLELQQRRSIRLVEQIRRGQPQLQVELLPHQVLPQRAYERMLFTALERGGGCLSLAALLAQARAWYGHSCARLHYEMILPDLIEQGYIRAEAGGLFRRTHYLHTPKGQYLLENLLSRLSQTRNIAKMLHTDSAAADQLLRLVGSTALLLPELQPEHSALHRALFPHGGGLAQPRAPGVGVQPSLLVTPR
jgi:hypothetical protein